MLQVQRFTFSMTRFSVSRKTLHFKRVTFRMQRGAL